MEGFLNRGKEKIFKQYEEVLPRVAKSTSFYRPDVAVPNSSPNCSVLAFSPPTLSLACPISLTRQAIPVRTEACTHIQTFDLHSAIFSIATSDMFKNANLWKAVIASPSRKGYEVHELWYDNNFCCPVCRRTGPLYVDLTIAAALACLPASVSRVAFTESGRFMAVEEKQLKVNEGSEVITLKDSPCMYNTPCYLLPSSSTTTSTATPPYLPTTPNNTSTPLLPTPTIVHHLVSSTPQPAPCFALTGTVKPQQHRENTGRFSSLRRPSLERCLQVMGAHRYRRLSTVDLTGDSPEQVDKNAFELS